MSRCLLLAILAACLIGSEITYGPWRSGAIGGGGWVQNVVPTSDPARFYAYVDVGGVFRSDDGGRSWRMLHSGLANRRIRGLIVDPRDSATVLIANGDAKWKQGIFRSTDAGATWTQVLAASFEGNGADRATGFVLDRHPVDPDVVVAASVDDGVWISRDNGLTWANRGQTGLYAADIRFSRPDGARLWLTATAWAWKDKRRPPAFLASDDGGATWIRLSEDAPTEIIQDPRRPDILYGIFAYAGIRRSLDGGASWTPWQEGLAIDPGKAKDPAGEHRYSALAAGPDFILTASARGTFYRLESGGTRWQRVERRVLDQGRWWGADARRQPGEFRLTGAALGSITVDPRDPALWFFTDWFSVHRSSDAGASWTVAVDGLEVTVIHDVHQDATRPGLVHVSMADNGYFRSEDGGRTWERVGLPGRSGNVRMCATSPSVPGRVAAVGASGSGHAWHANQVFVSDDAGRSWRKVAMRGLPNLDKHRCNAVQFDPRRPGRLLLAVSGRVGLGGGGVYASEDGGETWGWDGEGLELGKDFFREGIWGGGIALAVADDGGAIALGRDVKRMFRRPAGAAGWQEIAHKVWPSEPASVVADPRVRGRWWLTLFKPGGLLRSDDDGATWQHVHGDGHGPGLAVDRQRPGRIAVGGSAGTLLSKDGGTTWTPLGDTDVRFDQHSVLAFGDGTLVGGSPGNGAFWAPLP